MALWLRSLGVCLVTAALYLKASGAFAKILIGKKLRTDKLGLHLLRFFISCGGIYYLVVGLVGLNGCN